MRAVNGIRSPTLAQAVDEIKGESGSLLTLDDDDPFIVLTETKFSFRCIPVWIGTLLTGLGSKKKTHVIMFSP
jgi:hypothetical protein